MEKRTKRSLIWVGVVLFASILGAGAYFYFEKDAEKVTVTYEPYKVTALSGSRDLKFRGVLQSSKTVPVLIMTHGRITEIARQGSEVKKGDVLVQIDDSEARESIENQETSLNSTSLAIEQLEAQYNLVEFQEDNNVKQCKARLEHAILEEKEELKEPDERERRLMEIEERLAELDVEDAKENYERELRMFNKNYITKSALEPYERSLENAKATLEELVLKNNITRKGATDERKVELRKAVERAEANLQRVGLRRERRLNDIKTQIEAEKKNLDVINFGIKRSQNEIDSATVYAPADGVFMIVTYRDWSSGGTTREITVGDERHRYDVVGHIIDPASMKVRLAVNEADFPLMREGMDVSVTFPALPGKNFGGKLIQLGAIGKDRSGVDPTASGSGYSEVMMFNATVEVTGDGTRFHPGMSAIINVPVAKSEALLIPRSALQTDESGTHSVFFGEGSDISVVTGKIFNEMYFQVESGVKEGDTIYIPHTVAK